MSDTGRIVVSMRAPEGVEPAVEGSIRTDCANCGHDVWLSPATQQSIESGAYPDTVWCSECVISREVDADE